MEEQLLQELRDMYGSLYDFPSVNLPTALSALFAKEKREKKGFIFIIDEWDCIFREAPEDKQAQKAYLDFLRDLLKDRTYVKLAYMTGILPVKKYGTHSALNIFDEFSMTEPKSLAKYIGFSEENVIDLCEKYQMDFDEAKRWSTDMDLNRSAMSIIQNLSWTPCWKNLFKIIGSAQKPMRP